MTAWFLFGLYELALTVILLFAPLSTEGRFVIFGFILTTAAIAAATDRIVNAVDAAHCSVAGHRGAERQEVTQNTGGAAS